MNQKGAAGGLVQTHQPKSTTAAPLFARRAREAVSVRLLMQHVTLWGLFRCII